MTAMERIVRSRITRVINPHQDIIKAIDAHFSIDVKMASESLGDYLDLAHRYLNTANLEPSDLVEELGIVLSLMNSSTEKNLLLNIPLLLHYHKTSMKNNLERFEEEAREKAEERRRETVRMFMDSHHYKGMNP